MILITDQQLFNIDFNRARRSAVQSRIQKFEPDKRQDLMSEPDMRRSKSQKAALWRMMKLWDPFGKKLSIAGIKITSEKVVAHSDALLSSLRGAWSPRIL